MVASLPFANAMRVIKKSKEESCLGHCCCRAISGSTGRGIAGQLGLPMHGQLLLWPLCAGSRAWAVWASRSSGHANPPSDGLVAKTSLRASLPRLQHMAVPCRCAAGMLACQPEINTAACRFLNILTCETRGCFYSRHGLIGEAQCRWGPHVSSRAPGLWLCGCAGALDAPGICPFDTGQD